MVTQSPLHTVLQLLADGAYIEQVSQAPLIFHIRHNREAAPLPGGLMQQLLASGAIKPSCRVSGRMRYVAA